MTSIGSNIPKVRLLVVEDDPIQMLILKHEVSSIEGFDVTYAETGRQGLQRLRDLRPHVVLLDLQLPDMAGNVVLEAAMSELSNCSVYVISAINSVSRAMETIREGAADFLPKPLDTGRLKALLHTERQNRARRLIGELSCTAPGDFVAESEVMRQCLSTLREAARTDAPVLLTGEKGSGRGELARLLHQLSAPADSPFAAWNPQTGESFAHALERAGDGTLFIEELRHVSRSDQEQIETFLSEAAEPGSTRVVAAFDESVPPGDTVRIVAPALMRLFQMNTVGVPSLRTRRADIVPLAEHSMRRHASERGFEFEGIDSDAAEFLKAWSWPGNITELEETIEGIAKSEQPSVIETGMLPRRIRENSQVAGSRDRAKTPARRNHVKPLWKLEQEAIESAIDEFDGDVIRASQALGISTAELYGRLTASL